MDNFEIVHFCYGVLTQNFSFLLFDTILFVVINFKNMITAENHLLAWMDQTLRPILREMLRDELADILPSIKSKSLDQDQDTTPYGDFNWLQNTCPGIPASTLRIKSAAGEIPGVVKFGKRVLYEKAVVLNWLRSQTRTSVDTAQLEQDAEAQFNRQLKKKGGELV